MANTTGCEIKVADSGSAPTLLGCPWCGEQPQVTKHFKLDAWSLVHRCPVFTTMHTDWTELGSLCKRWNTRYNQA